MTVDNKVHLPTHHNHHHHHNFDHQELQRIVKDLFHLINEKNADLASQEVLAESGQEYHKNCEDKLLYQEWSLNSFEYFVIF